MKCPRCSSLEDKVIDSRLVRDGAAIKRRRECTACGCRFTTFEETVRDELIVVKRDGRREAFSRAKLEQGVRASCQKRPVSDEQIRSLLDEVVTTLEGGEVQSHTIGEHVMARLRRLDEVAYIRFASVYKRFKDVKEFTAAINEFMGK
ncbi:MAG: transcriptional repressor NrdR [Kiritimatiellae bacterium]|nr:transcriptional repressor NrdR [Kiritimatiellia bacterium]